MRKAPSHLNIQVIWHVAPYRMVSR